MTNPFNNASTNPNIDAPAENAVEVTPSDTVDLANTSRALYIGGDGTVKVITVGGQTTSFVNVVAGTIIAVQVTRVLATGTDATAIVNMY